MKRIIFTLLAAALMSVSVMAVEPTREETIALDDLTQSTAARKVVVNGQVLIIKDGKTFNLLGDEVK